MSPAVTTVSHTSEASEQSVGGLQRSFSTTKFTMGMGVSPATTSLSKAHASPKAFHSSTDLTSVSQSSSLGDLRRTGSSSRLQSLQGSELTTNLTDHFSDTFTASASLRRHQDPTSAPFRSCPGFSPVQYPLSPGSANKAPSLDSDSNMSLDSDNDDSADSDNNGIPPHYHQFYSTDIIASPDSTTPVAKPLSIIATPPSLENDINNSETTSRPQSPVIFNSEDDTAVRAVPSRHVDYLCHDWREEDIWESWKYVVSRRGQITNSARLENASWRTWMKSKNKLKTVSPETLNWLKESDVTWLYGPLQTGSIATDGVTSSNDPPSAASITKPILKKRSKSEAMLQRSLSTSSLVQQATAVIQAQENHLRRPILTSTSDHLFHERRRLSADNSPLCGPTLTTPGIDSPTTGKHIHFNEQVSQCIALDYKGDDDDEDNIPPSYSSDDNDDDGLYIGPIRRPARRVPLLRRRTAPAPSRPAIAMLPDTLLKCEEETLSPQSAMTHTFQSPIVTSSPESDPRASTTLRHAKKSGNLFVTDNDDDKVEIEQQEDISTQDFVRGRGRTMAARGRTPAPSKRFSFDSDEDEDEDEEQEEIMVQQPEQNSDAEYDDDNDEAFSRSLGGISMGGLRSGGGLGGLKKSTSIGSFGELSSSSPDVHRTSSGMRYMPYISDLPSLGPGGTGPPSTYADLNAPSERDGGIFRRFVDLLYTYRDIAHIIWNVGWQR